MSNTSPPQPAAENPQTKKLSFSTKLAYGAWRPGRNYCECFGIFCCISLPTSPLAAGTASNILLIGKVWDAINDPIVGVLSDRTSHPLWAAGILGWFTGQFLSAFLLFAVDCSPAKIQRYCFGTMWRSAFCLTRLTPPSTCLTLPSLQN